MKHKITGDIFRWNSSIWDFNYKMKNIKEDEEIDLSINSLGGDVFVSIDIMNSLRAHKGPVTITIPGIAASGASIICMGADTIKAYSNSQMMVHNASTYAFGNAKTLRKKADDLESIDESVLASYTHRIDVDTAKELLDKETFLTAKKALELGLIDEIIDAETEEVESEVFQNKAKEFNNKIVVAKPESKQSVSLLTEDMVKSMMAAMEEKLINELKPKEPAPEPVESKQNLGKLFLNLK